MNTERQIIEQAIMTHCPQDERIVAMAITATAFNIIDQLERIAKSMETLASKPIYTMIGAPIHAKV